MKRKYISKQFSSLTVYDKCKWQTDAGVKENDVISFFNAIMTFLQSKEMLSQDGKELLDSGIDAETSLHSRLFTKEGNNFMAENYDEIVVKTAYDAKQLLKILKNIKSS